MFPENVHDVIRHTRSSMSEIRDLSYSESRTLRTTCQCMGEIVERHASVSMAWKFRRHGNACGRRVVECCLLLMVDRLFFPYKSQRGMMKGHVGYSEEQRLTVTVILVLDLKVVKYIDYCMIRAMQPTRSLNPNNFSKFYTIKSPFTATVFIIRGYVWKRTNYDTL